MIILYGIKNCDTVKRAHKWLHAQNIAYKFHDFRHDGLDALQLRSWCAELGWQTLLNTRGTTWRQLDAAQRAGLDGEKAVELMLKLPSLIKRPVLDTGSQRRVGFSQDAYRQALLRV